MSNSDVRVVVAMSGGVDSSVAAALLVEQGYDVVGMMMRLWSDETFGGGAAHNRCCTPDQMNDARRIADRLGIPFYVLDTRDVFRNTVVEFFIDQHRAGVTPNPCMECNRHIRFTWLLNHALALDGQYLATGHYVRRVVDASGHIHLKRGVDEHKDQSYVLSVLTQDKLRHALFPVGDYSKAQVRETAARFGLPTASRKDSQDLCFLGNGDYRDFLVKYAPETRSPGPIVLKTGEVIGEHAGLANYTIGQRKGLGVTAAEPLYVIGMNPYRNALIVGTRADLGADGLTAHRVNWVAGAPPSAGEPFRAQVKIRYKANPMPAWVRALADDRMAVTFDEPLRDITPGQGAVVYDGDECLGGGIIERSAAQQVG